MFSKIFKRKKQRNESIIDLTKLKSIEERQKVFETASENPANGNDTNFLSSLASAAVSSEPANSATQISSTVKMDGERVERLNRQIDRLLDRLELMEHKIERIENRVNLKY